MGLIFSPTKISVATILTALMAFTATGINAELSASDPCIEAGFDKGTATNVAHRLVHNFWSAVEHQNTKLYSKLIADCFQGLNIDGHYDKKDQIEGLESLRILRFKIHRLHAVRQGDTLVVSYDFQARGQGVTSGPSIDVWRTHGHYWRLISHSYVPFKP